MPEMLVASAPGGDGGIFWSATLHFLRGHLAFFCSAFLHFCSASFHFLFGHLAFLARPPHIFWSSTLHFFSASLHFLLGLLAFLLGHLTFFGRPPGIWYFLLACRPDLELGSWGAKKNIQYKQQHQDQTIDHQDRISAIAKHNRSLWRRYGPIFF